MDLASTDREVTEVEHVIWLLDTFGDPNQLACSGQIKRNDWINVVADHVAARRHEVAEYLDQQARDRWVLGRLEGLAAQSNGVGPTDGLREYREAEGRARCELCGSRHL